MVGVALGDVLGCLVIGDALGECMGADVLVCNVCKLAGYADSCGIIDCHVDRPGNPGGYDGGSDFTPSGIGVGVLDGTVNASVISHGGVRLGYWVW